MEGFSEYTQSALEILRHCLHQRELTGGKPMWCPENHLIKFVPDMELSDPSYHLPHFYRLFALETEGEDRAFWTQAAAASEASSTWSVPAVAVPTNFTGVPASSAASTLVTERTISALASRSSASGSGRPGTATTSPVRLNSSRA